MNQNEQAITIGQLARQHGLSRSTLLYYDRLGLLGASGRTNGNYRLYSPQEADRLKRICFFRRMGIPLKEIARLLGQSGEAGRAERILQNRLEVLTAEINERQEQQRQILRLLDQLARRRGTKSRNRPGVRTTPGRTSDVRRKESSVVNKQQWVNVMRAAGFSEEDMRRWHQTFEKMEPQGHQEFLESLNLPGEEIDRIRRFSAQ